MAERAARRAAASGLGPGLVVLYVSVLVLLPLAALAATGLGSGLGAFWAAVTQPESFAALRLTLLSAFAVVVVNAVAGTAIAWVLVRDRFRGRRAVSALVDLPLALPTVVAGLTLLTLYGTRSPFGLDVAFTRVGIVAALAFVTLPFSVRSVQPVLAELDREAEEAAASLGARPFVVARRIVLPALVPSILSGAGLGFARAVGEYGSVVLLSGNLPFRTEVASVRIFGLTESGALPAAAAVSLVLLAVAAAVLGILRLVDRRLTLGEEAA